MSNGEVLDWLDEVEREKIRLEGTIVGINWLTIWLERDLDEETIEHVRFGTAYTNPVLDKKYGYMMVVSKNGKVNSTISWQILHSETEVNDLVKQYEI